MNPVVHFEIPFDDSKRAQKFYKELFGWQLNDLPEMKYCMAITTECDDKNMPIKKGTINGGLFEREGNLAPLIIMNVPSIEKHLKKAESMGSKIVLPKQSVGEMGFYARITDSEGNVIGLWEDRKKES